MSLSLQSHSIFCLGDNCQCDNIAISRGGGPFEGGSTCFNPGGNEFCYISKASCIWKGYLPNLPETI